MRLLNVKTLKLEYFYGSVPAYAILSHTWGADDEELSFDDIEDGRLQKGATMPYKVAKCCAQAEKDGLNYAWVDTCCIIKVDPTELGEAINSMLRWYNEAAICYAYLADVSSGENGRFPLTQFCSCRWFKRGWRLQELLAPDNLRFYDSRWHYLGTKATRSSTIERRIEIPRRFLQGTVLSEASKQKREEDIAYCLLGIFDVTMPMVYGEGSYRAFTRLQQEIMRKSRGESMLAWGFQATEQKAADSKSTSISAGVLEASPADFMNCGDIVPQKKKASFLTAVTFDGGYVRISLSLFSALSGEQDTPLASDTPSDRYLRPQGRCSSLFPAQESGAPTQPVFIQTERQKNTSTDPSPSKYFFLDDPVEIGLELIEVEPPECWLKEHALIATSSDPNVDSNRAHDFLVLLEFQAKRSQFQARCHMMTSARNTPLADLAQSAGRLRQDAFGKRSASDGTLSIQASVERDSLQKIFVLKLATMASPPSVTVDTTFELEELMLKLELESLMKDEDNVCGEAGNINEQEVEASSSLEFAKASLAKIEEKLVRLNELKARLLEVVNRTSQGSRRRSLVGKLDDRKQTALESGYGLPLHQTLGKENKALGSPADDTFWNRFFKDKELFVAHLVKKAIYLYSDYNNTIGPQNIVLLSIRIAMFQQVFYCDDCPVKEYNNRRDAQTEFVKRMTEATTKILPHGKGVALRFINHDADNASNLNSEGIQNIMESLPLGSLGYTAIVKNLRSKVLEPLVNEKIEDRRLDRPLIITITIGRYLEFRAESELAGAIIECGKKLHDAGYARNFVAIEEETLPTYNAEKYYPVRLGDILHGRYQVVAKLGYGVTSTVWLGRDLSDSKHVALKIYVTGVERNHELDVYDRIGAVETDHAGQNLIRKLWGHFFLEGPHGRHMCLVHQPLGLSVNQFLYFFPGRVMRLDAVKPCMRQVLGIVDFLHTEAQVIHTDLQLKNLLLPGDPKNFSGLEDSEIEAPSPRKLLSSERTIYTSHIVVPGNGLPLLSDFGEARFTEEEHDEDIMPNLYRAPEVVLKMNWDSKVDVWSIALMAWDMVCTRTLFDGRNSDGIFDDQVHLAEMVAIMGPPPTDFIKRSKVGSVFWDENGKWKDLAPVPKMTLEERAADIQGPDKEAFLKLMRRALTWDPRDRPAAGELIFDEWLMKGLQLPAHLSKET
ncbi:CMGC protein kinase [Aspergillus neoniger CBS 115656]|uniref:CMGC protein kinase n=1 Tax=Aspergillus neoniger (strain CBS 115656) TaxID=1448310 RepID=A0A318Z0S3_ASPNB|nr:CMGC protein kinase [Aspergillus neoniger CBS 115656]PYH37520.1 CMGC protein kinase [Aspergillus neoniger CBS 115656]